MFNISAPKYCGFILPATRSWGKSVAHATKSFPALNDESNQGAKPEVWEAVLIFARPAIAAFDNNI